MSATWNMKRHQFLSEKTGNAGRKFLFEANRKRIFNIQLAPAIRDRRGVIRQSAPAIRDRRRLAETQVRPLCTIRGADPLMLRLLWGTCSAFSFQSVQTQIDAREPTGSLQNSKGQSTHPALHRVSGDCASWTQLSWYREAPSYLAAVSDGQVHLARRPAGRGCEATR